MTATQPLTSLEIVTTARLERESKLDPSINWMGVEPSFQAQLDRECARDYDIELSAAPDSMRETLRLECNGDPTLVYAVLNNCVRTRNETLLSIMEELHG